MPTDKDLALSRRSLRRDQVLELHLAPLPVPPEAMLKLPGVREWWEQMMLARERDQQALHRWANNLGVAANGSGP